MISSIHGIALSTISKLGNHLNNHPWRCWAAFASLVLLVFAPSLGSSPPIWQDEVQIVDYGRAFLDPDTDWGVTWSAHKQRSLPVISYFGCVGAELCYRVSGSVLGSRAFCVTGGVACASLLFGLALMGRVGAPIAFLIAGLALLEPGLVSSYRGGRVDAWALAMVFAGTLLVHLAVVNKDWRWLLLAGACLAASPYFWLRGAMAIPTAVLPLVISSDVPVRRLVVWLVLLCTSTAVTMLLLLPPAWPGVQELLELAKSPVAEFRTVGGGADGRTFFGLLAIVTSDIRQLLSLSVPLLLLSAAGTVAILCHRSLGVLQKVLASAVILTTLFCHMKLATGMNPYAALYWLPLVLILAWQSLETLHSISSPSRWNIVISVLALLLTGHFLYNGVGRTFRGWTNYKTRGPQALKAVAEALPTTASKIVVADWRLYFLLRERGYKPYYLFTDVDVSKRELPFPQEKMPLALKGGPKVMWTDYIESMSSSTPASVPLPMGYSLVSGGLQ